MGDPGRANDTATPFGIGALDWPGIAKLMEEAGEVVQVCSKLIATGGRTDHWSGDDLRVRLAEELGDLWAAVVYVHAHNLLGGVTARRDAKMALYQQWHGRRPQEHKSAVPSTANGSYPESFTGPIGVG